MSYFRCEYGAIRFNENVILCSGHCSLEKHSRLVDRFSFHNVLHRLWLISRYSTENLRKRKKMVKFTLIIQLINRFFLSYHFPSPNYLASATLVLAIRLHWSFAFSSHTQVVYTSLFGFIPTTLSVYFFSSCLLHARSQLHWPPRPRPVIKYAPTAPIAPFNRIFFYYLSHPSGINELISRSVKNVNLV